MISAISADFSCQRDCVYSFVEDQKVKIVCNTEILSI